MFTFYWLILAAGLIVLVCIIVHEVRLTAAVQIAYASYLELIKTRDDRVSVVEMAAICVIKGDFAGASWLITLLNDNTAMPAEPVRQEVELYWGCFPGLGRHELLTVADFQLLGKAVTTDQQVLAQKLIVLRHERDGYRCPQVPDIHKAVKNARRFLRQQTLATQAVLGCTLFRTHAYCNAAQNT